MNKVLTGIVWACILGILGLPSFSVSTRAIELISLSTATEVVVLLAVVGAITAWWRMVSAGKLNEPLADDVEAARRYAQLLIFPETRLVGWKAPRISQCKWNECVDSPKTVASILRASSIKTLPVMAIGALLLWVALEQGVFHRLKNQSRFELLLPFFSSPIVRAIEISFLCLVALTVFNLLLCRNSALNLNKE